MRALITRPREDAEEIGRALAARGFSILIEPMIDIVHLPEAPLTPLDEVQAILATSANGVRALAARDPARGVPLFAVGDATARCARGLGYTQVELAGGDVASLVRLVSERAVPADGALLHVAGSHLAGDLKGGLAEAGFEVHRAVLYEAKPATAFGPTLLAALDSRSIDAALFFSPRTAVGFVMLAQASGRLEACASITAYGLSRSVATMLRRIGWRRLRAAGKPSQELLLAAIDMDLPLLKGGHLMRGLARLIRYLILVAVLIAASVWLADHPGSVTMNWLGWRVSTSMAVLLVLALVILGLLRLGFWLLTATWRLPRRLALKSAERSRQDGLRALADGVAAAAMGEGKRALRLAQVAERKLADPSVTAVLTAQAAQMAGDDRRAEDQYRTLLARPETAPLGLRGLLKQALDSGDNTQALDLALQSRQSAPTDAWTADVLFGLLVRAGRFEEAENLVDDAERSTAMAADIAVHRRALVLNERAAQASVASAAHAADARAALAFARRAVASDAGFAPAAARLATLYTAIDRRRRADAVLAKAWRHRQSPDLLRAVADDSPLVRLYRLERMVDDGPDTADSAFALGEVGIEAKLWGQARKHLLAALAVRPSVRIYLALARLEELEYADQAAAQSWRGKAELAPIDPSWRCGSCQGTASAWSLLCPHCGEVDTLSWPVAAATASGTNSGTNSASNSGEPAKASSAPTPAEG